MPLTSLLTFEEWLEGTAYPGHRKDELRAVYDLQHGARPSKAKCRRVKSFLKAEDLGEFKSARWINSRCDAFKVFSGPLFKSIEQEVYKSPYFVKHVPVADRPACVARLMAAGAKYCGTDYTAFEASFLPEIMRAVECQLYEYMLSRTSPGDASFITEVLTGRNVLTTRAGLTVSMDGRRMSGDMCTSLGNGFTNLMIWAFLMHRRGINPQGWDGLVEGDDGLFSVFAGEPPTPEEYGELGFSIKIETVEDPREANFCGMIVAGDANLKDPASVLGTLGWSFTQVDCREKRAFELQRAKALSLIYEMPRCPVLRAYADRVLRMTEGSTPYFVPDAYKTPPPKGWVPPPSKVSSEARLVFERKFGVGVEQQLHIESLLESDAPLGECFAALAPPVCHIDMAKYVT